MNSCVPDYLIQGNGTVYTIDSCYKNGVHSYIARFVWSYMFFTFNNSPPRNAKNIFGDWLRGIPRSKKDDIN
jgi:hypothetical protein